MMDWTLFLSAVTTTETPLLPAPGLARAYLAASWALVLVALTARLLPRRASGPQRWQYAVLLALALWTLWPGPASPAYWLGLAFRAPSVLSVLLCAWWLLHRLRPGLQWPGPDTTVRQIALAGSVLGWVLLLDTLAFWPQALYAWGYSPLLLGGLALAACLPWLGLGAGHPAARVSLLLGGVLLLHVLLRLPTGNVWDAVLDPWLWLVLQIVLLRSAVRRLRRRRG